MRTFTVLSCAILALSSNAFAVVNGQRVTESVYPAVKKIELGGSGICTGTFIGPRTMITAAHCIEPYGTDVRVEETRISAYRIHPRYADHAQDKQEFDVALIQMPAGYVSTVARLAQNAAEEGAQVTVVGYGISEIGAGLKHVGTNRVAQKIFGQYMVHSGGSSLDAVCLQGDSGGPLLNSSSELIGTTNRASGPKVVIGGRAVRMSSFVDLKQPEIESFIKRAFKALNAETGRAGH